jgi:hypothetical protein
MYSYSYVLVHTVVSCTATTQLEQRPLVGSWGIPVSLESYFVSRIQLVSKKICNVAVEYSSFHCFYIQIDQKLLPDYSNPNYLYSNHCILYQVVMVHVITPKSLNPVDNQLAISSSGRNSGHSSSLLV